MALGVLAEIAPVAARVRQPLRPVVLIGLALASSGVLGAVTQSNHVLNLDGSTSDRLSSTLPFLLFNGLPLLGVLVVQHAGDDAEGTDRQVARGHGRGQGGGLGAEVCPKVTT